MKLCVMEIERFALHDGPGIRTTIFFKGCSMRCPWCSNPESQAPYPEVMWDERMCGGCGRCAGLSRDGEVVMVNSRPMFERSADMNCKTYVDVCPAGAITQSGHHMTPQEIMAVVMRDAHYYADSGGGVTLSGGEALEQGEKLLPLLQLCKEQGISVAVETCGQFSTKYLDVLMPYIDIVLFDIKHYDPQKLGEIAGESEVILANLDAFVASGRPVTARIPVLPRWNHSVQEMEKFFAYCRDHGLKKVDLLPYHTLGKGKYAKLGLEYNWHGSMLQKSDLAPYVELGQSMGLVVGVGGS